MKVALCTPVYLDTRTRFTLSLAELLAWSMSRKVIYNGAEIQPAILPFMTQCTRVDQARERLAERALRADADYILWLDADQTFPPETLFRLAAHDLPLVGCNYVKRREGEHTSTAFRDGEPIEPKEAGIEPVDLIGFGVLLMKIEVLKALPRPWFKMPEEGEDGYFCQQAKAHGIQPYVDHSLSMEVGHIAETVLRF